MRYSLSEIVDVKKTSQLLKSYTELTGLVSALLDLNGTVLVESGWQRICTDFHRINPESEKQCKISDTTLANSLARGGKFNVYKCLNGLVDVAVPLNVNGEHVGNLFTGQFFLEEPDISFFEKQAEKYNFKKQEYLKALQDVPIINLEDIKSKLAFLLQMTEMIGEIGFARIVEAEAKNALEKSEAKFRGMFENLNQGFALHEILLDEEGKPVDYRFLETNPAFNKLTGLDKNVIGKTVKEALPGTENDPADWIGVFGKVAQTGESVSFEQYSENLNKWYDVQAFSPEKGLFAVTFTDITQRVETQRELYNSVKKYQALVEQSLTGIYIFSKEKFLYVNKRFCEIFAYSEEEILSSLKPTDVVERQERQSAQNNINDRLSGKVESVHYIARGKRKDNKELWIEIHGTHLELDGEHLISGTVLDITEKHKSNQAIAESEKKYRTLFDFSPDGIVVATRDWDYLDANHQVCEMLGYTKEELSGMNASQIGVPVEKSHVDKSLLQKIKSVSDYSEIWEFKRKDGSQFIAEFVETALPDGNQIGIIRDVTEKYEREKLLLENERKFRTLFEQASVGVAILDSVTGKYVNVNKKQCEIVGYSEEEILSLDFMSITLPEDLEEDLANMEKLKKSEISTYRMEKRYIHKNGSLVWVYLNVFPLWRQGESQDLHVAICEDITEKKLAEKQIRESEERYRSLFENMNSGFVLFEVVQDEQGNPVDLLIVSANRGFEDTTGLNLKDAAGQRLTNVLPGIEKDEADWIGTYSKIALTGEAKQFEQVSELLDTYYSISAFQAGPKLCAVTFTDISLSKKAELKIFDSEKKYRAVVDQSLTGVYIFNESGFIYVNRRFAEIFAYSVEEIISDLKPTDLVIPAEQDMVKNNIDTRLKKEIDDLRYTARGLRRDKSQLWVEAHGTRTELNGEDVITGTLIDVTDKIVAEQALRKSAENLQIQNDELLKLLSDGSWFQSDFTTAIQQLTEFCSKIIQSGRVSVWWYSSDYSEISCFDIFDKKSKKHDSGEKLMSNEFPTYRDQHKAGKLIDANDVFTDPRTKEIPREYYSKYGIQSLLDVPVWLGEKVGGLLSFEETGRKRTWTIEDERLGTSMATMISLAHEINERKVAEADVRKLNQSLEKKVLERTLQLESINNQLESFTYSVSHDLKAPLRGINGYSILLEENYLDSLDEEAQQFIKNIKAGTDQMNQLIDDLLEYSRLERSESRKTAVDISVLIKNTISSYTKEIDERSITINVSGRVRELEVDAEGLSIVIRNLIGNAIKFTKTIEHPDIQIMLSESDSSFRLTVKDNGIGFDMKFHDKIFELFQSLHRKEDYPGTGIGLALVYKALEKMDGKIWAESKLSEGAAFYVEIPFKQ